MRRDAQAPPPARRPAAVRRSTGARRPGIEATGARPDSSWMNTGRIRSSARQARVRASGGGRNRRGACAGDGCTGRPLPAPERDKPILPAGVALGWRSGDRMSNNPAMASQLSRPLAQEPESFVHSLLAAQDISTLACHRRAPAAARSACARRSWSGTTSRAPRRRCTPPTTCRPTPATLALLEPARRQGGRAQRTDDAGARALVQVLAQNTGLWVALSVQLRPGARRPRLAGEDRAAVGALPVAAVHPAPAGGRRAPGQRRAPAARAVRDLRHRQLRPQHRRGAVAACTRSSAA